MGVSKFIYMGPHLVLAQTQVVKPVDKSVCSNVECKNHHIKYSSEHLNKLYCSSCGNRITTIEVKETKIMNAHQIIRDVLGEDCIDVFYVPHNGGAEIKENVILPNSSKDRPVDVDLDDSHTGYIPMPSQSEIEADVIWFNEKYGEYVKAFNDAGVATEFRYGFMVHYS